jgi:hypothetical protein
MGLRDWTAEAINEGNTPFWAAGLLIKLTVELMISGLIGYGLARLIIWRFEVDVLEMHLGTATTEAIWITVSIGLFRIIYCNFTKPLLAD